MLLQLADRSSEMRGNQLPNTYFSLSRSEKTDLIEQAASELDRPSVQLEKDIWVVIALDILFSAEFGKDLIFKGGTSLSKVYKVIRRFSEDIDVTVDINRLLPKETELTEIPRSRNQAKKWKQKIEEIELPKLIENEVASQFKANLPEEIEITCEVEKGAVYVDYTALAIAPERRTSEIGPYIETRVKIEFGGASSGRPNHETEISSDVSEMGNVGGVNLPSANVRVMDIQRTFWEKATLAHVACVKGKKDWRRYARHWHDLVQIYGSEYWDACLGDLKTAKLVAVVKKYFYRVSGIDFEDAVTGNIRIVPDCENLERLQADYQQMDDDRLFNEDPEPFDELITKCDEIANALNGRNLS